MAAPPILFQTGIHASRPAANTGIVHYYCTTHSKLEQSDGTAYTDLYDFSSVAAPTGADYLVGTAQGSLSAEIVVGTTPGGELGGTWGSPTVDGTHSGSAHSDFIAKAFFAAKGDLIGASANDTPSLVSVGTDGYELVADSAQTAGLAWVKRVRPVNFVIDGGGSTITTGVKGDVEIPFSWRDIVSARLLADQSGSIVVNIWKDTYANFPPVVGDKITASAPPTISTATKSEDTTLTGWTKTGSAGDILRFNVDSVTTIQRVTLCLVLVA